MSAENAPSEWNIYFEFQIISVASLSLSLSLSLTHSLDELLDFSKQDTNIILHFWLKRFYDNYIAYQKLEYYMLMINRIGHD